MLNPLIKIISKFNSILSILLPGILIIGSMTAYSQGENKCEYLINDHGLHRTFTKLQIASIASPKSDAYDLARSFSATPSAKADDGSGNILGMFIMAAYGTLRYNVYDKGLYTMNESLVKGGGVNYEIPLEFWGSKFSVYNELGFSLFKSVTSQHYGDTVGGDPIHNYYDVNATFAPNLVFLTNMLRYTFTPGEFKYYASVGITCSFVVSSTNTKETLHITGSDTKRYMDEFIPDPTVFGITVPVSTGFSYRNVGLEIRFDPGRNFSSRPNYAVYMPSFYALLHARFNPR